MKWLTLSTIPIAYLCFGILVPRDIEGLTSNGIAVYVVLAIGLLSAIGGAIACVSIGVRQRNLLYFLGSFLDVSSLYVLWLAFLQHVPLASH